MQNSETRRFLTLPGEESTKQPEKGAGWKQVLEEGKTLVGSPPHGVSGPAVAVRLGIFQPNFLAGLASTIFRGRGWEVLARRKLQAGWTPPAAAKSPC